ncbi:M28 family metallopeptidase [Pyxidicoccus xibeiensis]|uniref:M28 family metallopeptidase n=1 Tax=Pyxidicoccus xibeiensis TaxID=2906759 RepID=UPI0020A7EB24|nr:M28 family metallopeptidase [Pyxidicoccus xibeiensis]MCP3142351.1 M28 family metallopeptidase [Pyxidicoccus xibeiensis]
MMRRPLLLPVLALLTAPAACTTAPAPKPTPDSTAEVERWWGHVQYLASDALEGRDTGSEGYRKASAYVAEQLQALGVQPGAGGGYLQEIDLVSRRLVEERSGVTLVRDGQETPLVLGQDAIISPRAGETGTVDAPMVFVGYGLSIPEAGHDDFADMDLKGKVAVFLYGGPASISGPLRAHSASSAERVKALLKAGAVGTVLIQNPKQQEVPWSRVAGARHQPAMQFADAALNEDKGMRVAVTFNPEHSEKLFAGSPHGYKALIALSDANKPLPRFELPTRLKARVEFVNAPVKSANVVGVLPGSDAALAKEYVVLSAHLDHVGVGAPVNGDNLYNGAMDNATGVAAVLEVARALQAARPRRSVLFTLVTGEEKGLLGSRYFAARPTVPGEQLVANFNLDMFLPLFVFNSVVGYGADESSLGGSLAKVAAAHGVKSLKDHEPHRMLFIRSDQYAFIRQGVPALSFKFGYVPGTPEERVFKAWYTERYHAPSDDLAQPMDKQGAVEFVRMLSDLTRTVADAPERPRWNPDSFFRRFDTTGTRGGVSKAP